MVIEEAARRDAVLRAYLQGRDWDDNDEFKLKRAFVLASASWLPDHPYLVDDEWDVKPGHPNHGRGDLVFTDGVGRFAVVEVKYIDLERTGKTARVKRTKDRGKVLEQAETYAQDWAARTRGDSEVVGFAYTNEGGGDLVEVVRLVPEVVLPLTAA